MWDSNWIGPHSPGRWLQIFAKRLLRYKSSNSFDFIHPSSRGFRISSFLLRLFPVYLISDNVRGKGLIHLANSTADSIGILWIFNVAIARSPLATPSNRVACKQPTTTNKKSMQIKHIILSLRNFEQSPSAVSTVREFINCSRAPFWASVIHIPAVSGRFLSTRQ